MDQIWHTPGRCLALVLPIWVLYLSGTAVSERCNPHIEGFTVHQNKTHKPVCCRETVCGAGTEPHFVDVGTYSGSCLNKTLLVMCRRCPPGTYQRNIFPSSRLAPCIKWRACNGEGEMKDPERPDGTSMEDRVCLCNKTGNYTEVILHGEKKCRKRFCPAGEQTKHNLNDGIKNCEPCPPGTEKLEEGFHLCYPPSKLSITNCTTVSASTKAIVGLTTTTHKNTDFSTHKTTDTSHVWYILVVISVLLVILAVLLIVCVLRCHINDCNKHELCKQIAQKLFRKSSKGPDDSSTESFIDGSNAVNKISGYVNQNVDTVKIHPNKGQHMMNGDLLHQTSVKSEDSAYSEGPGNGNLLKGGKDTADSDVGTPDGEPIPQYDVEEEDVTLPCKYEVEEESEPKDRDSGNGSTGPHDSPGASKDKKGHPQVIIKNFYQYSGNVNVGDHAKTNVYEGPRPKVAYSVEEDDCVASPFDPAQVHGTHV